MRRSCDHCGVEYEAQTTRSKYHSPKCRRAALDARKATPVVPLPARETEPAELSASVQAALEDVGRASTPLGLSALLLAGQIEAGGHTGSALAALNRELRSTLAEATRGTVRSSVAAMRDELAARRRQA